MNIMIIGASGQLGSRLAFHSGDSLKVYHKPTADGNLTIDVTDFLKLEDLILKYKPDTVVNATAIADVEKCEVNHDLAYAVNALAVRHMVRAARVIDAYYVHFSTDYVFSGDEGLYSENSVPAPINYYGLSKLIGDSYALSYDNSLVIRTSGVFGTRSNFPLFALERLRSKEKLPVIDARYSPIHADMLARASLELIYTTHTGLLNVAGEPISRIQLAHRICELGSLEKDQIEERDEKSMNWKARRPADSSLNIEKSRKLIGFDFASTDENLKQLLNQNYS